MQVRITDKRIAREFRVFAISNCKRNYIALVPDFERDFGVCMSAHGTVTFYLSDDAWLPSYPFAHTRQPYACLNTSSRIYLLFHGIYPTVNPIPPSPQFLRKVKTESIRVLFIHELIVFRDRYLYTLVLHRFVDRKMKRDIQRFLHSWYFF